MELIFVIGPLLLLILLKAGALDSCFKKSNSRRKPKLWLVASDDKKEKHEPVFEPTREKPPKLDVVDEFYQQREIQPVSKKIDAYYLNKRLFTPYELRYLKVLQDAVGHQYWIMGKVRIADIFGVRKTWRQKDYYYWFNRIKAKHFDYVLCHKETYKPIAAIELDDSSHLRKERVDRDEFVNEICANNKFLLLRVKAKSKYEVGAVRDFVCSGINDYYGKNNR